jgi:hypothetical protein
MSFRSAPIIEQPIHKFACEKPEYLNQQARDYLDRIHWLPRFIVCRESATRPGNPFNKRISKAGKVKAFFDLEKQLRFHEIETAHRQNKKVTHRIIMIFSRAKTGVNFIRLSKSISCSLAQIQQQNVQIPEIKPGNL